MLAEFPLADTGTSGVAVDRILRYTSSDWGWWRTVTGNLVVLDAFIANELTLADLDLGRPMRFDIAGQVAELWHRIEAAPKSRTWRLRAAVGDRVPWYEEPEEEAHE